jgi:hypothetical protein
VGGAKAGSQRSGTAAERSQSSLHRFSRVRSAYDAVEAHNMATGTVKWFSDDKGFGFPGDVLRARRQGLASAVRERRHGARRARRQQRSQGSVAHAELLARRGEGVLLHDARGRGESDGSENNYGTDWATTQPPDR